MKNANMALAFLLEVTGLFVLGYWGFTLPVNGIIKIVAGIGAPVLMIFVWSIWCAPSSTYRLENISLVVLKVIIFALVSFCLVSTKHHTWAAVFALLVVLNLSLSAFWGTL